MILPPNWFKTSGRAASLPPSLAAAAGPGREKPNEPQEFKELPEAKTGEWAIPVIEPDSKSTVDVTSISASSPVDSALTVSSTLEPKATIAAQPMREPTRVSELTVTPRLTPEPTIQKTVEPTPTFTPTVLPTLTPTPKPVSTLYPLLDARTLPHVVVGSAIIDSVAAPDGTVVSVWMEEYSEPLESGLVYDDAFTVVVPQYGTASFNGRIVQFKLDGLGATPERVWASGGADILGLKAETN